MPEKYLRRDGIPILVRHTGPTTLPQDPPKLGDGPVVFCLHDAGLQSSVFAGALSECASTLPGGGALAFDLPGHGRSGSLDSLPSVAAMTELARWVAEGCGIAKPWLVGHGMGALIALEWARTHRESLSGLVLCGTGLALGVGPETIEAMRKVTLGKAPRPFDPSRVCPEGGQEMMRRAYMEGIQTDPRATLGDLEAIHAFVTAWNQDGDAPRNFDCPITFLSGEAEAKDCRKRTASLANTIPGASATTLEKAAHFLPLEQPAAFARELHRVTETA